MIRRTLLIFFKVSFQNFWQSLRLHKFSVKFFCQGFDEKMKNPNGRGRGVKDYGIQRAGQDNTFWKFGVQGVGGGG